MRLATLLLLAGCDGKVDDLVVAAEVTGHWTGDWGDMVLAEGDVDGALIGAYTHDEGTVQGVLADGVFTGWWCETPSREPDNDAGEVEFEFLDGGATLDGRWRYGTDGEWSEDWDLDHVDGTGPEDLVERLSDATAFCDEP